MTGTTLGAVLALTGGLLAGCGAPAAPVPDTPLVAAPAADPTGPVRPASVLPPARPVAVAAPSIDMHTGTVVDLGLDPGGVLEVPPDAHTAGWSTLGPSPGGTGPAVIAAHVDHSGRPGVFARLPELVAGEQVAVRRDDGTEAVFAVYRVERYPRTAFPADRVFGATPGAELRLITWGGVFDRGIGRHPDNVVAFGRLVGVRG
jgi:hypothetical protein